MLEVFGEISLDSFLNKTALNLEGKVVLVEFWTYSSLKCHRAVQAMKKFREEFQPDNLAIIGVHTPEFKFEREKQNVVAALERLEIRYPVILDNDYYIWSYFNNQSWPAHYVFDSSGELVFESFEEGDCRRLASVISNLAGKIEEQGNEPGDILPETPTEEICLGRNRGTVTNAPDNVDGSYFHYVPPDSMEENNIYLEGGWQMTDEYAESGSDESSLQMIFNAREAYAVASSIPARKIKMSAGSLHHEVEVSHPDLYGIFREKETKRRSMEIKVPKGIRLYALSFR